LNIFIYFVVIESCSIHFRDYRGQEKTRKYEKRNMPNEETQECSEGN